MAALENPTVNFRQSIYSGSFLYNVHQLAASHYPAKSTSALNENRQLVHSRLEYAAIVFLDKALL
jgi:hypothetical protein